jgi:MFS family permease
MRNSWSVLAVLFTVRATMAFQFQSVASVAPLLGPQLDASLADIGLLIGLYFTPGIALALPGGAIGGRLGDKRVVLAGLGLMLAGSLIMAFWLSWPGQVTGRLMAGTGGVLLNVLMTKMVADWFAARDLATAMAIFVNSWPVGIAIALVALPLIATAQGIAAVHLAVAASIAIAFVLLAMLYVSPKPTGAAPGAARLAGSAVLAVIMAGLIWTSYNIGLAMVFSFGPSMLAERGWSLTAAGSATSMLLWLLALSVPLGGLLADRARPGVVLAGGCLLGAALLLLFARSDAVMPAIIALGLAGGLPAGAMMSLPARVLAPQTRAVGMGVFYTVFYLGMMLGPALGGSYAAWAGSARAALDFGAALLVACLALLWSFEVLARRVARAQASVRG